jgi:hypothetical protein
MGLGLNVAGGVAAIVTDVDKELMPVTNTPFDMAGSMGHNGRVNPGHLLRSVLGRIEAVQFTFHGKEIVDGTELLRFDTNEIGHNGLPIGTTFLLDPKRGMLLIQMKMSVGNHAMHAIVTDSQRCPNDRWFPTRIVVLEYRAPDRDKLSYCRELKVVELDATSHIANSQFTIKLPRKTLLRNLHPASGIVMEWDRIVGVNDFEALAASVEHALRHSAPPRPR